MDMIENCVVIEDVCIISLIHIALFAKTIFTIALSCSAVNMGPVPP